MLQPHVIRRFAGLANSVNPLDAPEGSAEVLENCVLRSKDLLEPRPGFSESAALGGGLVPGALAFKDGRILALSYATASLTGALNYYDPASNAWTALSSNLSIDRPGLDSSAHTRFVSANKALYFQSAYGLTKVETLSPQVTAGNTGAVLDSNVIALWRMDEASGAVLADSSGNAYYQSAPVGAVPTVVTGQIGNARSFVAASSQYFVTSDMGSTNAGIVHNGGTATGYTTPGYTIEGWFQRTGPKNGARNYGGFIGLGGAGNTLLRLYYDGTTNNLGVGYYAGADYFFDTGYTTPLNAWFHAAVRFTNQGGSNRMLEVFVNGVKVYTSAGTLSVPFASTDLGFYIGVVDGCFGTIKADDIRFSKVARTDQEILGTYKRGIATPITKANARAALQPKNWAEPTASGAAGALAGSYVDTANAIAGNAWLANNRQAAYRLTFARYGANKELIESEPSEQLVCSNTGGGAIMPVVYAAVGWMVPDDAFVRLYRTNSVTTSSTLSEEYFLVREIPVSMAAQFVAAGISYDSNLFAAHNWTDGSGNTKAVLITMTDPTPDAPDGTSAFGPPLYTNQSSGSGAASADTPAPLSFDCAYFKNRLHLLNFSDVQRLEIKVIGTGTGGIVGGTDYFTLNGVKFSTTAPSDYTKVNVYTSGTVAQNIENTARDLVRAVNRHYFSLDTGSLQQKLFATYLGVGTTNLGLILIQSVVPGAAAFSFSTSSANGWDADYTAGTTSDPNAQVAGWMWSNSVQAEAVPTSNNEVIGDSSQAGQRLLVLRDSLFAFKKDGLWKITDDGTTTGIALNVFDPTVKLVAPETAVTIDNCMVALCEQGVTLIVEGGKSVVSHSTVHRELIKLVESVGIATMAKLAFAVAYESTHEYILCLPESANATACTVAYVFNLQTEGWTTWRFSAPVTCGGVNPDTGALVFGTTNGTLLFERKNGDSTDYQDPGFSIACPATTATATLVFTGTPNIVVGDIIQQAQATYFLQQQATAVSYNSGANQTTVTLDAAPAHAWSNGVNLTVVKAIISTLKFLPIHMEQPATAKALGDVYAAFKYFDLNFFTVEWATDLYPVADTAAEQNPIPLSVYADPAQGWGSTVWDQQVKNVLVKLTIPNDYSKASQIVPTITFANALGHFELSALDFKVEGGTDRAVR